MTAVIEPPGASWARGRPSAQPCESPPAPLRPSGSGPWASRLRPTGSPRLAPAPPQAMSGMRLEPPFRVRPGLTPELGAELPARARQGEWEWAWSADPERLRRTPRSGPPPPRQPRRAARRVANPVVVRGPFAPVRRFRADDRRTCGYSRLETLVKRRRGGFETRPGSCVNRFSSRWIPAPYRVRGRLSAGMTEGLRKALQLEKTCNWAVPASSCAEINAIRPPEVTRAPIEGRSQGLAPCRASALAPVRRQAPRAR